MWKTVLDSNVRHVWRDVDTGEEITVSPDWYQNNGTPTGDESDMVYVRTEILEG